jgi:23S rRNA (uracil1939-C5)-methyltransferase
LRNQTPAPEIVEVTIRDIALGGDGVGRMDNGMVVFVPFTIDGERVRACVERHRRKSAEARLLEVLKSSPVRVDAPCAYFGRCGGCSYQHLKYEAQLAVKSRQVEQTLRRVGKLERVPMRAVVPSPNQFGYRNRIRVHVEDGRAGFFAIRSHDLIEIERCAIADDSVNERLAQLRGRPLIDGDYTLAAMDDVQYFSQINDRVAREMVSVVASHFRDTCSVLVDAFCGAGFFSRNLIDKAGRLVGIERNKFAVERARELATEKETYIAADVEEILGAILSAENPRTLVLLLDPPAAGISPRVRDVILSSLPETVIYVSCNPATLARDLLWLSKDYFVEAVTPLDMFPQTAEIEVVACLRLKSRI